MQICTSPLDVRAYLPDIVFMTSSDLLRRLRRLASKRGWEFVEVAGKGSHLKVTLNGRQSVIPRHNGDMKTGTYRSVLRDLELTIADVEN